MKSAPWKQRLHSMGHFFTFCVFWRAAAYKTAYAGYQLQGPPPQHRAPRESTPSSASLPLPARSREGFPGRFPEWFPAPSPAGWSGAGFRVRSAAGSPALSRVAAPASEGVATLTSENFSFSVFVNPDDFSTLVVSVVSPNAELTFRTSVFTAPANI